MIGCGDRPNGPALKARGPYKEEGRIKRNLRRALRLSGGSFWSGTLVEPGSQTGTGDSMPIRQPNNVAPVTPALMTAFARTVSPERWSTYQRAAGFNDDLAHRLYLWNASIGQSFHYPLQSVEVALRNVVHAALSAIYGPNWTTDHQLRGSLQPHQLALCQSFPD